MPIPEQLSSPPSVRPGTGVTITITAAVVIIVSSMRSLRLAIYITADTDMHAQSEQLCTYVCV